MDGIQKSVHLGLSELAREVEQGLFGTDDDAFTDSNGNDEKALCFLNRMHDLIIDRME